MKISSPVYSLITLSLIWLGLSAFVLSPSLIPEDQILSGGPPKDGIPALSNPKVETANSADQWLKPDDTVLGIVERSRYAAG